jgi:prepilin-type N-terminal cleavage/methylation domain-containing protein
MTRAHRRGFSLAELLVGMAILALLAAVLIPAVTGQISKGDATRTIQDLTSIRTGVEQFVADVRRYPGRLSHLTNAITAAQRDVNGTLYPAGLVPRWKGPYVTRDLAAAVTTGFGGTTVDSLVRLTYQPGVNYVTVQIAGITQPDFDRMDLEIDGAVNAATGLLRWVAGDTVRYLAMPIQ